MRSIQWRSAFTGRTAAIGGRVWEIYNNTFTNTSSTRLRGATLRGGTGVIYGNTYGGTQPWYGLTMLVQSGWPAAGPEPLGNL